MAAGWGQLHIVSRQTELAWPEPRATSTGPGKADARARLAFVGPRGFASAVAHAWRNGRRARLRIWFRKEWRFKSSRVHQLRPLSIRRKDSQALP